MVGVIPGYVLKVLTLMTELRELTSTSILPVEVTVASATALSVGIRPYWHLTALCFTLR
jgi:hypothetical protein